MRILQIFNRYIERGGEEASVERASDVLSGRHEVFHCYFDSRQLGPFNDPLDAALNAAAMIWNRKSARRLRTHAAVVKPDILLLHNLFPAGSASILHEIGKLNIPAVSYIHNFRPYSVNGYLWANDRIEPAGLKRNFLPEVLAGSWQNSRLKTGLYAGILTGMHGFGLFRRIRHWIAISDFMRNCFISAGVPPGDISTVYHSWDPVPNPPEPRDGGYYLFLGRLIAAKGIRVLFDAWEQIEARTSGKGPGLVIGGDGPLREEVAARAEKSRLVRFVGHVDGDEKAELLRGCRAMIAPSLWWESLGLVTYEAYDHFKPMLAASSGGLTETVAHGVTGMLHEPGNASALAAQVLEIDGQPERRMEMGRKGREWLLANTNRDLWLDQMDRVFSNLAPKAR